MLDDLSTGHADAVPAGARLRPGLAARLRAGAGRGPARGGAALRGQEPGRRVASSSPRTYWHTNVGGSLALLEAMRAAGLPADRLLLHRGHLRRARGGADPGGPPRPGRPTPTAPRKLAVDHMLTSYAVAHGFAAVSLRYFNVAGAAYGLGERHATETHLIPIALQVAAGQRESLTVFGEDYPTPDGTCIRDYVHVADLADGAPAGAAGARRRASTGSTTWATAPGFSVQEVVDAVREVTGHPVPVVVGERRAGDPAQLVASSDRIRADLGWTPRAHRPGRHRRATPGTSPGAQTLSSDRRGVSRAASSASAVGLRAAGRPAAGRCAVRRAPAR